MNNYICINPLYDMENKIYILTKIMINNNKFKSSIFHLLSLIGI